MQICGEDQYPCRLRAHDLQWADYLDIDYDAVSHAFVLRAFWSQSRADDAKWYETHLKGIKSSDTLEVGVLMNEISEEEEELRYSGFLTQVGRDKKPSTHPLPY
jgi:hypothetical protein